TVRTTLTFFFSSRRRHTRSKRDWSSDVCSSDLVMILDEATVMLDPIGRIEIMETMTELQQKESLSFITITHDLNEVKLVDKVIVMNEGNVWEINTPKEILKEGNKLKEIGL